MLTLRLMSVTVTWIGLYFFSSCSSGDNKKYISPDNYDFSKPYSMNLPIALDEVSGLSYYPQDSSVFAIVDEDGMLFKIYLNGSGTIKEWKYDKKRDFEDIVVHDSVFYILVSNGDIETLKFIGDSIHKTKSDFPNAGKKVNEFESLYLDDSSSLTIICKSCEDDTKREVSVFNYTPESSSYASRKKVDVVAIANSVGESKLHFKPSAAAINPVTKELFILASVNKLLVITDASGTKTKTYKLNPAMFNQPEGITFTPTGDLIIANELGEKNAATLLVFKRKK